MISKDNSDGSLEVFRLVLEVAPVLVGTFVPIIAAYISTRTKITIQETFSDVKQLIGNSKQSVI